MVFKMSRTRGAYLTTKLGSTCSLTALRASSSFGCINKVSLISLTHWASETCSVDIVFLEVL